MPEKLNKQKNLTFFSGIQPRPSMKNDETDALVLYSFAKTRVSNKKKIKKKNSYEEKVK